MYHCIFLSELNTIVKWTLFPLTWIFRILITLFSVANSSPVWQEDKRDWTFSPSMPLSMNALFCFLLSEKDWRVLLSHWRQPKRFRTNGTKAQHFESVPKLLWLIFISCFSHLQNILRKVIEKKYSFLLDLGYIFLFGKTGKWPHPFRSVNLLFNWNHWKIFRIIICNVSHFSTICISI